MHAIKGGCSGQVFALSTNNDSGGKRSRIRRSKEERKMMVETFIKNFQKSNNGNFPSLNLTHKEVGGSFYTVREIVREIIQENRVLAPAKVSLEEHDHSGFLEQHPLGSISIQPEMDFSGSDGSVKATPIMPHKFQTASKGNVSNFSMQFRESYPVELDDGQINKEEINVAGTVDVSDASSRVYHASDCFKQANLEEISNFKEQPGPFICYEFENKKAVNGIELLEENLHSDKLVTKNVDCQKDNDNDLSAEESHGIDIHGLSQEHHLNGIDKTVDKTREFRQRISPGSGVLEILDTEKNGAKDVEASRAVTSHMNSSILVEKFPLRPVPSTIHDEDGESGGFHMSTGKMEHKANQHDQVTFIDSPSDLIKEKNKSELPDSTMEFNVSESSLLEGGDTTYHGSKDSLTKAVSSAGNKNIYQDASSLGNGNNPTVEIINLQNWDRPSNKFTRPESNHLLAMFQAFLSHFTKFWTA